MKQTNNNYFVVEKRRMKGRRDVYVNFINKLFKKAGFWHRLMPIPHPAIDMNTIEHRINFYHLLTTVIDNNIDGEVVELGSFTGQCAVLFQKILQMHGSNKELYLYDTFETKFTEENDILSALKTNFENAGLRQPIIHKGFFEETLPHQLPQKIAFAHIDCGFGGDKHDHKKVVLFCLQQIYHRLSKGAVCTLMDYHDANIATANDSNPGVKLACDEFFADKPEQLIELYANQSSHAYFKKK